MASSYYGEFWITKCFLQLEAQLQSFITKNLLRKIIVKSILINLTTSMITEKMKLITLLTNTFIKFIIMSITQIFSTKNIINPSNAITISRRLWNYLFDANWIRDDESDIKKKRIYLNELLKNRISKNADAEQEKTKNDETVFIFFD